MQMQGRQMKEEAKSRMEDGLLLKAAVCEDDTVQRRNLRHMLEQWGERCGVRLVISDYATSEAFLYDWDSRPDFDILLLDIDLGGGMSGMELARRVRQQDENIVILFITGLTEYMPQGYDVQAFHFLVKPLARERLCEVLDKALAAVDKKEEFLLVRYETSAERIPLSRILYIEAFSHRTELCAIPLDPRQGMTERREIRMGMKELEEALPSPVFFRCHRSYIVNLQYVCRLCGKGEVILDYAGSIPVSRKQEKALYQAFLDFHRAERHEG